MSRRSRHSASWQPVTPYLQDPSLCSPRMKDRRLPKVGRLPRSPVNPWSSMIPRNALSRWMSKTASKDSRRYRSRLGAIAVSTVLHIRSTSSSRFLTSMSRSYTLWSISGIAFTFWWRRRRCAWDNMADVGASGVSGAWSPWPETNHCVIAVAVIGE